MPPLGKGNRQIPEMCPILRCHEPGDTGPHHPQGRANAKDNKQQADNDHRAKGRLQVFELCEDTRC